MEEEYLLKLKIAWMHQYIDSKIACKRIKNSNESDQKQHSLHQDKQNNNYWETKLKIKLPMDMIFKQQSEGI